MLDTHTPSRKWKQETASTTTSLLAVVNLLRPFNWLQGCGRPSDLEGRSSADYVGIPAEKQIVCSLRCPLRRREGTFPRKVMYYMPHIGYLKVYPLR